MIKLDYNLRESDVMVLAETWIPQNDEKCSTFELESYETHLNNCGRGKGIAAFYKQEFRHTRDLNEENISITKLESIDMDVIAVYRSQDGNLPALIDNLQELINFNKTTLIIGDMNICNMEKPKNKLRMYLEDKSFKQIIKRATHIEGCHIDHAYILNNENYEMEPSIELVPKYYSDHDALCISWKKK